MKIFTLLSLFFYGVIACGQDIQKGYYIDASGQRAEGFFSYGNFADPSTLKFSNTAEGSFEDFKYNDVAEYGVENDFKYQKVTVDIEVSTLKADAVSKTRNPEWGSKTIFVNVLLEGDASLYSYYSPGGSIFFYKINSKNVPLSQLVYKKYYTADYTVAISRHYQQQMFTDVNCKSQGIKDFNRVRYSESSLIKVFSAYNECSGNTVKKYDSKKDRSIKLEYTVFAGVNHSNMKLNNTNPPIGDNTDTQLGLGFGGEVAIVVPSRKFSFFLKADYEHIKNEFAREWVSGNSYVKTSYNIDITLLNLYVGARYNYLLNPKNKLFIDAAFASGFPWGSFEKYYYSESPTLTMAGQVYEMKLGKDIFFNFGIGYTFNNKYGIDLRVDTPRDFFNDVNYTLSTKSYRVGLNLRYTIN